LRFSGEAVVNPDRTLVAEERDDTPGAVAPKAAHPAAAKKGGRHSR